MSFIDKFKDKAEAVSAAIDNELTVLEGAGGDDVFADDDQQDSEEQDSAKQDEAGDQPSA